MKTKSDNIKLLLNATIAICGVLVVVLDNNRRANNADQAATDRVVNVAGHFHRAFKEIERENGLIEKQMGITDNNKDQKE